jgi:hypothetical protein
MNYQLNVELYKNGKHLAITASRLTACISTAKILTECKKKCKLSEKGTAT